VVLGFEQLALAVCSVLLGGIFMLLLGTQILKWYWLVLLGVVGIAIAVARIRDRVLTRYKVAQLVDHKLQLNDSLSTAWFLLSRDGGENDAAYRIQLEQAERVAAGVKPSVAFPFQGQRSWAVMGALAGVAFGLFATRYLVTGSLSLERPFVPVTFAAVFERVEKWIPGEKYGATAGNRGEEQVKSARSGELQEKDGRAGLLGSENSKSGKPDGSSGQSSSSQLTAGEDKMRDGRQASRESSRSPGQANQPGAPEQASNNQPDAQQAPNAGEQQSATQQNSSGVLDKMKDALSSLMAQMRPRSESQQSAQNQERSSQEESGGDQGNTAKEQAARQQDARNEQAAQQESSEGEGQGQTTEKPEASGGRNSDQSPEKKSSDARSGAGRQEGDKDVQEAEQLRAMGKLAEIIGKRSASITGEMMVETRSGKQQLKTEYSQRMGHHSDLGGEINRDEIPLIYQQYIREYMEQVRKQQAKNGQ